jgi:acid phosphatase (class A)
MKLSAATADTSLVPGLTLPRVPGLPAPGAPSNPGMLLPPPPAPGSAADRADMAAVRAAQRFHTPEADAWAQRMADKGSFSIWMELASRRGGDVGRSQVWLGAALTAASIGATAAATYIAKERFDRARPYVTDPSLRVPVDKPIGKSYPSGHTSSAYAAARMIATLEPKLAAEAYNLAAQVAVSRVYSGVHYPSDVVVGAALGTSIADRLLKAVGKGE